MLRRIDWQLIIPVLVLTGISLATLFSINISFFRNQVASVVLSAVVFLIFTNVDYSFLEGFGRPIYILSLLGFLILLFLGYEARGAARWLDFFGLRVQFSEIFKPFLAVSLAGFLVNRPKNLTNFGLLLALMAPLLFLIYKQPDLGSALVYFFASMLTVMLFGYPLWWFGILGLIFGFSLPIVFRFLHSYQQQRILTFLHLSNDPLGSSYNSIQAIIAIGSGMFVGKGLGQGTQSMLRFLPEQHTDFIFATLSEDLGFIGAMVVVVALGFLLYRLYTMVKESSVTTEKIFLLATFSLFFIQSFANIGMNIGILPIVGVPLPFVSYGGSSLISSAIFLGIASGIGSRVSEKATLEIR